MNDQNDSTNNTNTAGSDDSCNSFVFNPAFCTSPDPLTSPPKSVHLNDTCDEDTSEACVTPASLEQETVITYKPSMDIAGEGCTWYDMVGVPSTPPGIPCAPHSVGFGRFDGGVAKWTLSILTGKEESILNNCSPCKTVYTQTDWDSFLNLNSHPEWQSNLTVMRERGVQNMTVSEMLNLADKIDRLQVMIRDFNNAPVADASNIGIGLVELPNDDPNAPKTYGLTATINQQAVGTPLPLVAEVDGNGVVVGVTLPVPT